MSRSTAALEAFVTDMKAALAAEVAHGESPATVRRRLRTVTRACGARVSTAFLQRLHDRLAAESVYTRPSLRATGLRRDDWIHFSLRSFPAEELLFPREEDLRDFIVECLGTGVFEDLKPYHEGRKDLSKEYLLPNGRKIDLLCEEKANSGKGALVAMELKIGHRVGVVEQLLGYLHALKSRFPHRRVRGIIVTGRRDATGIELVNRTTDFSVDWFCYSVQFTRVSGQVERSR